MKTVIFILILAFAQVGMADYSLPKNIEKTVLAFNGNLVQQVNNFFNGYNYFSDKEDHWSTPTEFISNRGGDCEDFAIIKQRALQALGVPSYLGYFKKKGVAHMVTIASYQGKVFVLDLNGQATILQKSMLKRMKVAKTEAFLRIKGLV